MFNKAKQKYKVKNNLNSQKAKLRKDSKLEKGENDEKIY